MIKKHLPQELRLSLRIIMLGDTNVGKSTLIGVLVNGIKDDGKGKARMNVFKYKHEVYQGTTSSLTHQVTM
jgi:GTPase